jgi:putative phosphoesterase
VHPPELPVLGVISDTHGHLSADVLKTFSGVDRIIHAGDIGGPDVLERLSRLAPVTAVRGNMDGGWAANLKMTEVVEIGSVLLYVVHDMAGLDLDPPAAGLEAVIYGHTHQPFAGLKDGILYLNPGSASLPRRRHPPSVAVVRIQGNRLLPEFIQVGRK